ncbi:MAG: DUF4157 domain-containing protein, partial [Acidimicrobiia bacterium]|nr:DUF4157 domain-containing protein [Acidimicrobiia bacterium]
RVRRAVRLERAGVHWLLVGGPVPRGADAITLGPVISVRQAASDDEHLLGHEVEHVRQWRRLGLVGFLARYLGAYLRWRLRGYDHWGAYRRIPLEVEAEWAVRCRIESRFRGRTTPGGAP